jgi:hypothetical protein
MRHSYANRLTLAMAAVLTAAALLFAAAASA